MTLNEIVERAHHGQLSQHEKQITSTGLAYLASSRSAAELLPSATPAEVRAAVRAYVDSLPLSQQAPIAINDGRSSADLIALADRCNVLTGKDGSLIATERELRDAARNPRPVSDEDALAAVEPMHERLERGHREAHRNFIERGTTTK